MPVMAAQAAFNVLVLSLIAIWYVAPRLAQQPVERALVPLLFVHLVRPISLWTLVPGQIVSTDLPPAWAWSTAIGDLIATALALASIVALRRGTRFAIPLVWLFNIVGLLDAVKNGILAARAGVPAHMGAAALIPAYAVPVLLVSHGMIFWLLRRAR